MEPLSISEVEQLLRRQGFQPSAADLEHVHSRWQSLWARIQELNSIRFDDEEVAGIFSPGLPRRKGA